MGIYGNPVSQSNRKQNLVTTSTIEAEVVVLSQYVMEGIWLRQILIKLDLLKLEYLQVYEDDVNYISIANSKPSKHFDIKGHYNVEKVNRGKLKICLFILANRLQIL